jgi:hypothetical protein
MNQKNIAIAAVLAAALLAGIFSATTPMAVYAEDDYDDDEHDDDEREDDRDGDDDERDNNDDYNGGDKSETNTEQDLRQSNDGSGSSTNNNCGANSIEASSDVECFNGERNGNIVELLQSTGLL